jgi:hypothetical protein
VLAVVALLPATAGTAVPRAVRGSAARLRAALWLGACGTVLGLMLLLADDPFGWTDEAGISLAAAGRDRGEPAAPPGPKDPGGPVHRPCRSRKDRA